MIQIWVFAPQGRYVARINVKFGTGERTASPLPRVKFHVYRGNNVGPQPQNCQNFEFWPEICAWSLSRDKHPSCKNFPAVGSFSHKFSIAPTGETILIGSKKSYEDTKMARTCSITMPSMMGIVGREPAVDQKV